jgi:hypothetical protein
MHFGNFTGALDAIYFKFLNSAAAFSNRAFSYALLLEASSP